MSKVKLLLGQFGKNADDATRLKSIKKPIQTVKKAIVSTVGAHTLNKKINATSSNSPLISNWLTDNWIRKYTDTAPTYRVIEGPTGKLTEVKISPTDADLVTRVYGQGVGKPINTKRAHFTEEGLSPDVSSYNHEKNIWFNKGNMYMRGPGETGAFLQDGVLHGYKPPYYIHTVGSEPIVIVEGNPIGDTYYKGLHPAHIGEKQIFITPKVISYPEIKYHFEYNPLVGTFGNHKYFQPSPEIQRLAKYGMVDAPWNSKFRKYFDYSKSPEIKSAHGYHRDFTAKDYEEINNFLSKSTFSNFTDAKDAVAEMFRSEWYENNLRQKYPGITKYQLEYIIDNQIKNVYNSEGYFLPLKNLIGNNGAYLSYIDEHGTPKSVVMIDNNISHVGAEQTILHELIHSANPDDFLPLGINNDDIVMTPRKNLDLNNPNNKSLYDYITSPDELRVRLLRLNQIAHINNLSPQELLQNYRKMLKTNADNVPADLRQLLDAFENNTILKGMKKVVTLGTPIAVGTAIGTTVGEKKDEVQE